MSGTDADRCTVDRSGLDALFPVLRRLGYETIGPTVREGAIVYDAIESTADLPSGWTDEQSPGNYRLTRRAGPELFGYSVGPHSWKRFLHEPAACLFRVERDATGWKFGAQTDHVRPLAFIGMRACELHALSIRDRVLLKGQYVDPEYRERRGNVFIVAVHCSHPSSTCFCTSMKTGPRCPDGYDLALTEILEGEHRFLVEAGTEQGRRVMREIAARPALDGDFAAADAVVARASANVQRTLDTRGLKQLLYAAVEHPQYEDAARRCLACGNCTMVCPTCFCTTVEDSSSIGGDSAERWRFWDSCFSQQFSYIHGGSIRNSVSARFRHRIMHKFASWWDQFGTCGCVGCGRCTTWCPAGIDITEELRSVRSHTRGGVH